MSYTIHPFQTTIDEAEELIQRLNEAAHRLSVAIEEEKVSRAIAQDARESLEAAEAEIITENVMFAQAGEGPLAGIAKTSKAYQYAIDNMLAGARAGALAGLYHDKNRYALAYQNAQIELERAQVHFSACKRAADLKAAILNGHSHGYRAI